MIVAAFMASAVGAEAGSTPGSLFRPAPHANEANLSGLFVSSGQSFFEDRPAIAPVFSNAPLLALHGSDVEVIQDLIEEAESRAEGYDAVQHGARIKPRSRPTQMTLAQIFTWIEETPGQPHAIGRYQFIPATLRRLVAKAGFEPNQRFSPTVQDKLAGILLAEAGLHHFRAGSLDRHAFMNNLAQIWAGLPNSSGKSHYHGYAGNKASISWSRFDSVMKSIAPQRG
jgi:muramidase (phage lysozyme)